MQYFFYLSKYKENLQKTYPMNGNDSDLSKKVEGI